MQSVNPTQRFSNRVEHYLRYRPRYPETLIVYLSAACSLKTSSVIADVGSGTGFLTELFIKNGNRVFAVEPNAAMRGAAENALAGHRNFVSIDGTAEATTLPENSVNLVTAAQAFHWFDRDKTRAEFKRILKTDGWVALIWNDRRIDSTPFLKSYENLLQKFGTDYAAVDHKKVDRRAAVDFFGHDGFECQRFDNSQILDYEGLEGRVLSSSYVPSKGEPGHNQMLVALQELFFSMSDHGYVTIEYDTIVYTGQF